MIDIQDLTFTYPEADHPALKGVFLHVPRGELCLVMGASGVGKSTLLRCINGLVPHFSGGTLSGSLLVNGLDPVQLSPRQMSKYVGFVFQDPEAQFVVDRVEDEIAFSLENASMPAVEMDKQLSEVLDLLELTPLRKRNLDTLSGGERQRVAIAAALALRPPILVLDEPTSQLDPHAADEVLRSLMRLNRQLGLTVLLAEHRLERVLPYTGQVFYLSPEYPGGLSGTPREVLNRIPLSPPIISLGKALGWDPIPLTVEEAQACAQELLLNVPEKMNSPLPTPSENYPDRRQALIRAHDLSVAYAGIPALHGVYLELYPGEITVLMGPNGSGKTTLLRALIGLIHPDRGEITIDGKPVAGRSVADICQQVGYLPQDPNALLFADTVHEELLVTLRNHHLDPAGLVVSPSQLLERLGLAEKAQAYPRDLSTGERQRVALGAVLITHPRALLLDEPTRGLDYAAKQTLHELLDGWRNQGMAILLVTHDVELAVQVADRVILLEAGKVTASGTPREVLSNSPTFSPQVARIFPGRGWLTVEDALGGMHASQH